MKKLRDRVEKFKGLSVGLDLHKDFIYASVLDSAGCEIISQKMDATAAALETLFDQLQSQGQDVLVAMEASGCFFWVYDLLAERLGRASVRVAAPSKVQVIAHAGEKTDATDAWWLAYLVQEGRLPEAFVAEGDLRELRIVCRELRSVTDDRSDLMRRMRSLAAQVGRSFPTNAWSSKAGRAGINRLTHEVQASKGALGAAIARLWSRIQALDVEVDYWERQMVVLSKKFEEVALLDEKLPGVGPCVAAAIWSELGDPARFRSAKAYAKATGLTPGYRESGGHRRGQGMTRQGSALARWALTRAIVSCKRCQRGDGVAVRLWVENLQRRKKRKAAIVAAARKLAEAVWRLFALGEDFDLRRIFPVTPAQRRKARV